jgi:hypothetical protein
MLMGTLFTIKLDGDGYYLNDVEGLGAYEEGCEVALSVQLP